MDALQQTHRFARPAMGEPQQRGGQGPPPPWYSQFQYQSSAPQWAPPASDHHHPPPPPPHLHYHRHPHQPNPAPPPIPPYPQHYASSPLPPPHMPPPPPPSYPLPNQTWGNQNWPRQQGWDYPDRNVPNSNEEDWAARAKAWAAAKAAVENQQTQSQFTPVGRIEEHNHAYHDQYHQAADPLFTEIQKSSLLPTSHQQFSFSVTTHRPPVDHLQESTSFGSGRPSFYVPDGSVSYDARDGALSADSNPIALPQGNVLTSSSIYQQEVPSSYSSIPGNTDAGSQNEQFHKPLVSSVSSHQVQLNPQPTLPAFGNTVSVEQPHFMQWDQSVEAVNDANGPCSFDHVSVHDHDSRHKTNYMHPNPSGSVGDTDHIAAVSSVHAWTPAVVPGVVFPPIPPVPSGPQFDPTFVSHSSAPGHPAPGFGGISRPSFCPTIPPAGASFGLVAGAALHPSTAFLGDANGLFNVSERPKKASVPNWLREEIIKKASVASFSVQGHVADDSSHLSGTEADDKSFREGDQGDSKSIDSAKSAEDGEDDEDDLEAARSAAINQEIKRILTEVLLKVTDELFDEIATKVLSEDDTTVEVDNGVDSSRQKRSASAILTPKASAKVLIPVNAKTTEVAATATGKSNSSSPGDVLGLANYASEDDEEVQSSDMNSTRQMNGDAHQQLSNDRKSEDFKVEKEIKQTDVKEQGEASQNRHSMRNGEGDLRSKGTHSDNELVYDNDEAAVATGGVLGVCEDQFTTESGKTVKYPQERSNGFKSKDNTSGEACEKHESGCGDVINKKSKEDESQGRGPRSKPEKNDESEGKRSSVSKAQVKEGDDAVKTKQRHTNSEPRRENDRSVGKVKTDERNNGLKDRNKDHDVKPGEKVRESDSRKNSKHVDATKEDKKDAEKVTRVSAKDEDNRNRERTRDQKKEDRSRHRDPRDSHRHKRKHSSSVSRGKNSGDNSLAGNLSGSSDETSDNLRQRKLRSNKRSLSPSPVRSQTRHVSRSHSKHSQRRHSPYSSQETRGRRSRSGTPVRQRR